MRDSICPVCGSNEVYLRDRAWYVGNGEKSGIKILHEQFAEMTAVPTIYLCADCGYFESYIEDRKALELARRYWKRADGQPNESDSA